MKYVMRPQVTLVLAGYRPQIRAVLQASTTGAQYPAAAPGASFTLSCEQSLQLLVKVLSGVDQMDNYELVRMIERIHNPVLRLTFGEME